MDKKEQIKKSLNEWFKKQDRFKTKKEFSTELGIPYSTIKKYFSYGRIPSPQNREKLYRVTQLNCFETEVEKPILFPPGTMVQTILPSLEDLLKKIGDDIAKRNKIKDSVRRIREAWSNDDFDTAGRIISSENIQSLLRLYPEHEITVEKIKMCLELGIDEKINRIEMQLKKYCDDSKTRLHGKFPRFIIDYLINLEFNRKKNTVKIGSVYLQSLDWGKIQDSIEEERKRVWERPFDYSKFYDDIILFCEKIVEYERNPTGWIRLADIYQSLKTEIAKRSPNWKSKKRLVAYYKDEFSADLSKSWKAQNSGNITDRQIEFSAIRDPRLAFKVILTDGSTASYGFIRPKRR
ncbi:MAG: hypothetical protein MUO85_02055 [candidate division Zixibacteria bacterium]|nr:hypothetical protein [candidate division Zixibacteria bacterium]